MPVPTSSRNSTAYTISTPTTTPSRHSLNPTSPSSTRSYTPTVTSASQAVKLNVVSRVAIEGKARPGEEGASIKMYMKLAIPVDSISLGTTIALFPEENVKILTSQVHPLDNNSVPYNFSSSTSPLLHNAARALNLQARLPVTFSSAYHLKSNPTVSPSTTSLNRSLESGDSAIPPVDPHYTGQILVSGYNIAYVLPKCFPTQEHGQLENESERPMSLLHRQRRPSLSERNHAHFMAAVDMWVPYLTRPPRFPYLLSIPTPRCLHNNIRLRIFPPSNTTASFASLSSLEDDSNSWDLTSDPHVTRTMSNRRVHTSSYNHFADDESSDSSTAGFPDGFGIQGTFPSTEQVRVRWAKPVKYVEGATGNADTRRKVGVKEVKGEMLCVVRGKRRGGNDDGTEGIVLDVIYQASCKGVWFPGVATLLGLDVGLVAKNADVTWLDESPQEWSVDGVTGHIGFNVAGVGQMNSNPTSVNPQVSDPSPLQNRRLKEGPFSTPSLLRAPLPSQNIVEYSFEGLDNMATSHLDTISSVSSLSHSTTITPPGAPLTLHVNMNDVLPPNKIPFKFTIRGTILVIPRSTLSRTDGLRNPHALPDYVEVTDPISLPHFTVLAADSETTKIIVRNEVEGTNATVEVFSPSGDIYKDPQTRKTVLQKGGLTRCNEGGGRIALKTITSRHDKTTSSSRSLADSPVSRATLSSTHPSNPLPQIWRSPHLIHSVRAIVTPLVSCRSSIPDAYAVRIRLSTPVNNETDWLEFGLARVGPSSSRTPLHDDGETHSPKVHITGASVDGVPVQYTITNTEKQPLNAEAPSGAAFETMSSTEWASWVKIQVGLSAGDKVVIEYVVMFESARSSWLLNWERGKQWDLLLPTFTLPIGMLEVTLESIAGFTTSSVRSNMQYQRADSHSRKFVILTQKKHFSPQISLKLKREKSRWPSLPLSTSILLLPCMVLVSLLGQQLDLLPRRTYVPLDHSPNSTMSDLQEASAPTVTVTLATTITHCPSSSRGPVNPTIYPINSVIRPEQETSLTALSMPTVSATMPSSTLSVADSTAFLFPEVLVRDLLSLNFEISLWERLGLGSIRDSLDSIPDLSISSTKRTLTRYGRAIWDVIEYLLVNYALN